MIEHLLCAEGPIPSACTGSEAGLSGSKQIQIILQAIADHGGTASMSVAYKAIEGAILPRRLSVTGKAAVRCYVNRSCTAKGYLEADTKARQTADWRLTEAGYAYLNLVCPTQPSTIEVEPVAAPEPLQAAPEPDPIIETPPLVLEVVEPLQPLPSLSDLHDPILRVLGRLSLHTTRRIQRVQVLVGVLGELGFTTENLPSNWAALTPLNKPKIQEVFRAGVRTLQTMVRIPEYGYLCLTDVGLQAAIQLNGVVVEPVAPKPLDNKPNATSQWYTRHLRSKGGVDSDLMRLLRNALSRHLKLSSERGMVEDHINNFVMRQVARNSLLSRIEAGESIPYSKVAAWCVNSGRSDARNMGTNPVSRQLMGALTDKERRTQEKESENIAACPQPVAATLIDTIPSYNEGYDGVDFESLWSQVETIVRESKPVDQASQYVEMLKLHMLGFSSQEMGDQLGVDRGAIARMLRQVKGIFQGLKSDLLEA